jgi:hypothetical protein
VSAVVLVLEIHTSPEQCVRPAVRKPSDVGWDEGGLQHVFSPGRAATHLQAVLAVVVEGQRLRDALALVVAGALADGVHVAEVGLGLRVHQRVAVHLRRRRQQEPRLITCGSKKSTGAAAEWGCADRQVALFGKQLHGWHDLVTAGRLERWHLCALGQAQHVHGAHEAGLGGLDRVVPARTDACFDGHVDALLPLLQRLHRRRLRLSGPRWVDKSCQQPCHTHSCLEDDAGKLTAQLVLPGARSLCKVAPHL